MIRLILGGLFVLLGAPFLIRGLVFTLKPEHPASLKARERNLRMGLEADIKVWGRKVRRFGLLLVLVGGTLVFFGWRSL